MLNKKSTLWGALLLTIGLSVTTPALGQKIDSQSDKILKSMSTYLAKTQTFSLKADVSLGIVTDEGQKLQFNSFATATVQRPNKLHIRRQGPIADVEFVFNGQTFTVQGNRSNIYAQIPLSGTIDDAILALESATGIPFPGADLLFANPYAILSNGIQSGVYMGTGFVNGIECHHLAFREKEVDWELWVQKGEQPFPLKYVITTKGLASAPQFQIVLRDWVINPQIASSQFTFTPPKGARLLDVVPPEELEEFIVIKEKK